MTPGARSDSTTLTLITATDLTASGNISGYKLVEPVPDGVSGHWRASFDLGGAEGDDSVELRAFLKIGDSPISEIWLFQYHPF